jgi:hypothetical protein
VGRQLRQRRCEAASWRPGVATREGAAPSRYSFRRAQPCLLPLRAQATMLPATRTAFRCRARPVGQPDRCRDLRDLRWCKPSHSPRTRHRSTRAALLGDDWSVIAALAGCGAFSQVRGATCAGVGAPASDPAWARLPQRAAAHTRSGRLHSIVGGARQPRSSLPACPPARSRAPACLPAPLPQPRSSLPACPPARSGPTATRDGGACCPRPCSP